MQRANDWIAACPFPSSQKAKTVLVLMADIALPGPVMTSLLNEVSNSFFQSQCMQVSSKVNTIPSCVSNYCSGIKYFYILDKNYT